MLEGFMESYDVDLGLFVSPHLRAVYTWEML